MEGIGSRYMATGMEMHGTKKLFFYPITMPTSVFLFVLREWELMRLFI
jgi:hypothetical protein